MKPQEYMIRNVKKRGTWKGSYGEFQDYALSISDFGEPVKLSRALDTLTEDPQVGEVLYGRLVEEKARDGRIYYKLKEEAKTPKDGRELSIHAQFGLNRAVEIWIAQGCDPDAYNNIETEAIHFAKMVEKVRTAIS